MGRNMEKIVHPGNTVLNLADNNLYKVITIKPDKYTFVCQDVDTNQEFEFDIRLVHLVKVLNA